VLVAVLRDDGRGLELDDGERKTPAVHGPGDDPVPDLERLERVEVFECSHFEQATTRARLAAVIEIRDLRSDETQFLRDMLYAAIAWNRKRRLLPKTLLLRLPQLTMFYEGWGRAGDTGLVAEEDGRRVGLAWYRLFTDEVHGEGYVDEQTPEVAIAVVGSQRGRGIGTALMDAIHERARQQGMKQISLSVDADNPAKHLYVRLGYLDVQGDEHGKMILALA
jgi:ribosomal protein S18 acetylase RimI-like enzyme